MARQSAEPVAVPSPLLTFREACSYLRRGSTWLRQNADRVGVIRDGGKLLFLREDLESYVASKRVQRVEAIDAALPEPTPIHHAVSVKHRHESNPVTKKSWGA